MTLIEHHWYKHLCFFVQNMLLSIIWDASAYISCLNIKINIISKLQVFRTASFHLTEVEEDLLHSIGSFNETIAVLHWTDHTLSSSFSHWFHQFYLPGILPVAPNNIKYDCHKPEQKKRLANVLPVHGSFTVHIPVGNCTLTLVEGKYKNLQNCSCLHAPFDPKPI